MMPELKSLAEKNHFYGLFASFSACPPLLGVERQDIANREKCHEFNENMISFIEKNPVKNVVLISRWATSGAIVPHQNDRLSKPEKELAAFTYGLDQVLDRLSRLHIKIWIVAKTPVATYDIPSMLGRAALLDRPTSDLQIPVKNYKKFSEKFYLALDEVGQKYEINVLRPDQMLCSDQTEKCIVESDGRSLYRDHQHLSVFGSKFIEPSLQAFIDDLRKQNEK